MATVHIIGGGISGLAAATMLAEKRIPVKLYEATAHAGGRCRSSRDAVLGVIDHGLHLTADTDRDLRAYLTRISGGDGSQRVAPLPIPAAPLWDWVPVLGQWLRPDRMLAERLAPDNLLRDGWLRPMARLLFGTPHEQLPGRALRRYRRRLRMMPHSLQAGYVQPALDFLDECGGSIYFGHALTRVERKDTMLSSLVFARKRIELEPEDVVILATPPAFTQTVLPALEVPSQAQTSITLHFQCTHREAWESVMYPLDAPMDLLRFRENIISAAIRLADHTWQSDPELLAHRIWRAIQKQLPYLQDQPLPAYAVWREKRAGHAVSELAPIPMDHGRLLLAGDWLDPSRPATLEAAAASGHAAAVRAMVLMPKSRQSQIIYPD